MLENRDLDLKWNIFDCLIIWLLVVVFSNLSALFFSPWLNSTSQTIQFTFAGLVQTSLILLLVFGDVLVIRRGRLRELGLTGEKFLLRLLEGFLWGIVIFILVISVGMIVSIFYSGQPLPQPFGKLVMESRTAAQFLIPVVLGVLLAPLGEEIFFRGFLYPSIKQYLGINWGIFSSSLFFSLMHFDLLRLIPILIGSMVLAWLYEKTTSLVTSMAAHATWNGLMIIILLLSGSQFT